MEYQDSTNRKEKEYGNPERKETKVGSGIKDLHCHIMEPYALCPIRDFRQPCMENADQITRILQTCGLEALAIPAITLYEEPDFACNALSLYAKLLFPDRVYALAGLRRYLEREGNRGVKEQAKQLMETGFDGFKMICKPNARRRFTLSIDDDIFDPFYEAAEREQWPILFHVGDPASFWDSEQAPQWARENGWYYGEDSNVPSYQELYCEVEAVLQHYPGLRIAFAHFFFTSDRLDYAAQLFDTYPNIFFDVTPGTEMYLDFAARPAETVQFFRRYRDRILFGTDNIAQAGEPDTVKANLQESMDKIGWMRRFFETEEEMTVDGVTVRGIGLDAETLECLYRKNFDHFFHYRAPAAVDKTAAVKLIQDMSEQMKCATHEAQKTKELLIELEGQFRQFSLMKTI